MLKIVNTLLVFTLLFITACGPDYNTNFDPPPPDARLDDVFPKEISGMKSKIERMNLDRPLEGFTAFYGDGEITIDAILAGSKSNADAHFKEVIAPRFDKMKNHFRGNINGRWTASGTDENGRRWFAWVNNSWIFLVSGSDKENLSNAIAAFKYVSK
ncbi:MAG: hypothetical protein KJN64_07650 [Ignavibacteria bacterium]|nr:hypothetical protein [Ignavibacteria bacterium]MBT8383774.1 hypothetical protein [Ignavibacteria bacterium]MBT8391779.1 hypothetical protein [Ignavibacteria bacterium]NNJ52341.1 hypothetical protein [Ignavibacteriaceae bacterium]NNL21074.1 hypothetical protein [Ignavibacteriaceae bacterium]